MKYNKCIKYIKQKKYRIYFKYNKFFNNKTVTLPKQQNSTQQKKIIRKLKSSQKTKKAMCSRELKIAEITNHA